MRKAIVTLTAIVLLAMPLAPVSHAGPELPQSGCDLAEMIGVVNVRDCNEF